MIGAGFARNIPIGRALGWTIVFAAIGAVGTVGGIFYMLLVATKPYRIM